MSFLMRLHSGDGRCLALHAGDGPQISGGTMRLDCRTPRLSSVAHSMGNHVSAINGLGHLTHHHTEFSCMHVD
jgi:hypothetical protein